MSQSNNKGISLRTPAEVKNVRQQLHKEQDGKDALTGLKLDKSDAVLDHDHTTQYVRGVLHRQTNVVLGKIENLWTRYLSWWYNGDLPNFLRKCADYLEKPSDTRYIHPGWMKRVTTDFKKLNANAQAIVLYHMGYREKCSNGAMRLRHFQQLLKTTDYSTVKQLLEKEC